MELRSVEERLADAFKVERNREEWGADLGEILDSVGARMLRAIDDGLAELLSVDQKTEAKVARAWENLAIQGVHQIEQAGSLAPGLSHQAIYVEELRSAVKDASTAEEYIAALERLNSKWGSRIKYPLYAGGRRQQIDGLIRRVTRDRDAEEKRVRRSVGEFKSAEYERVRSATQERIAAAGVEFRGLLIAALMRPMDEGLTTEVRWFLINGMGTRLYEATCARLGVEDAAHRDLLYFALERTMRSVYESFQYLVSKSGRLPAAGGPGDASAQRLAKLLSLEIQFTRRAAARYETSLNHQKLNSQLIVAIRNGLKSGSLMSASNAKIFAEVSSCLRTDMSFEQFAQQLKGLTDLDDQEREEIVSAIKTSVEPFRSLYYSKINFVRYLKGLKKFQNPSMAGA